MPLIERPYMQGRGSNPRLAPVEKRERQNIPAPRSSRQKVSTRTYALVTALFTALVSVYLYQVVQNPYAMDAFMRRLPEWLR